jgi:predicted double-glycine peptidase
MASTIDTPYVGQVGQNANQHGNDCGAASVAMVLSKIIGKSPTVDSLYDEVRPSGNEYLSVDDLMTLLSRRGVSSYWKTGMSLADLYWVLATEKVPVICLVNYGALYTLRPNSFKGSHFMVIMGIDLDYVYAHDPLNTPTIGEGIKIPLQVFKQAWNTVGDSNPQGGMIIPAGKAVVALKKVMVSTPDGLAIRSIPNTPGNKQTLLRYALYKSVFTIYEEVNGWGRVHPDRQEWMDLKYTSPSS